MLVICVFDIQIGVKRTLFSLRVTACMVGSLRGLEIRGV